MLVTTKTMKMTTETLNTLKNIALNMTGEANSIEIFNKAKASQ
jgi:MinD-like ATPase involved in chromosome partitioning or flagellar assembly